jgi:8-oxo-dGTP diphosphatase
MNSEQPRPRIGIGIFIFKEGKFLMGRRKGAHGADTWSIPGGHLEFGESFAETATREAKEESNLDIKNPRFVAVTNDFFKADNKHYVTIWLTSDYAGGEPAMNEPDKYIDMGWYDFDLLPAPLFFCWEQLLASEFMPELKRRAAESKHA